MNAVNEKALAAAYEAVEWRQPTKSGPPARSRYTAALKRLMPTANPVMRDVECAGVKGVQVYYLERGERLVLAEVYSDWDKPVSALPRIAYEWALVALKVLPSSHLPPMARLP